MSRNAPGPGALLGACAALTCALVWRAATPEAVARAQAAATPGLLFTPAAAAVPALCALALLLLWRLPRGAALALLATALLADSPSEKPAAGLWDPPLNPLGALLFENLNKLTGVPSLRFAGIDLLVALLVLARLAQGARLSGRMVAWPLGAALGAVLGLEFLGLWRGGDFKNSLWQVHQPLFVPLLGVLFLLTLEPRDHLRLGVLLLGSGVFKALCALYFRLAICRPQELAPPYAGTHSDSVIYASAAVAALALWHERRTRGSALLCAAVLPLLGVGMYLNQRRLVYVALGAALVVLFAVVPRTRLKQVLVTGLVLALPLLAVYLAAGWNSGSGVFRPAQIVKQVLTSKGDSSAQTRDIENYNLTKTLKDGPLLGQGFGRPYHELVQADDISVWFPQYRYIPHNSFLGLWAFGGLLGFAAFWSPLVAAAYLAARAYRHSRTTLDRATALTVLGVLVTYAIQTWGDMGLQSWLCTALVAAALAVAANLAEAVEPARAPAPARARAKECVA